MQSNKIDAATLSKMFLAGAKRLESEKEIINELNVFPVPDGDTGTNMSLTIMSAVNEVEAIGEMNMTTLSKAISSGSLRGARGNSGVILSQLFRGFTKTIKESEELDIDGFRQNPKNRCYLCKHELFTKIGNIAKENGVKYVVEGSNMDDLGDYRPGLQAVAELGVKSPLAEAGLSKAEIRALSKELGTLFRTGTAHLEQTFLCMPCHEVCVWRDHQRRKALHGGSGRAIASGSGISSGACTYPWKYGQDRDIAG